MNSHYFKQLALFLLISLFITSALFAQQLEHSKSLHERQIGVEVQWYPAGWIIGPVFNYFIAPKHILNFRAGVNIIDRHDWSGLNDSEKGTGYGGSIGYRYLFTPKKSSFFAGARVDLWSTNIKWENKTGTPQATSGTTNILVLQPSAEIGYWIRFKRSDWSMVLAGGVGQEINIETDGREVGQGGMWLLGISGYYSF